MDVKVLNENGKNYAKITVVGKIFPYKNGEKQFKLVDSYGKENSRQVLLCSLGLGKDYGWITLKATNSIKNPTFIDELSKLIKFGDTIEVTGLIDEREVNSSENGIDYLRTLRVINLNKVKVVDVNTCKRSKVEIQGKIESLVDNELVIDITNEGKYPRKIHMNLNNECLDFIMNNVNIGDVVKVSGYHINKFDKENNQRVNCLLVDKIEGYSIVKTV